MIFNIIEDFWKREHEKNGYEFVRTPHIGNRKLWEISGHWGFYADSMYPPMEVGQSLSEQKEGKSAEESEQYLLKPMNCPFHLEIYNTLPKSYRELPLRRCETGTVYRFEKKGQL
jgi:threonyl-tRNA synthetase